MVLNEAVHDCRFPLFTHRSAGGAPTVDSFYDGFLKPLTGPIFFTSCAAGASRAILFVPVGQSPGRYTEFAANGLQSNGALVRVDEKLEFEDMLGGLATAQISEARARALAKSAFELVFPGDFQRALAAQPRAACPSE